MQQIPGSEFKNIIIAGAQKVISRQDYLNKINVFPVPDSDTGTNMAYTMSAIQIELENLKENSIFTIGKCIANAAIDGSRGNSGAILTQFWVGFSESLSEGSVLDIENFVRAIDNAQRYATEALDEPREGTILTVMTDWAKSIEKSSKKRTHFKELFLIGFEDAKLSLSETPKKLKVLEKAGVVDAGAQGFVDFLEGIQNYLETGIIPKNEKIETVKGGVQEFSYNEKYRYCTECVVTGQNISKQDIRKAIGHLGNSLVLAGTSAKLRIHIHTNTPEKLMEICRHFGSLSAEKADDMLRQQHVAHGHHSRIAVVVDSGCDLPKNLMDEKNIHMIPVRLNFGKKHYVDRISMTIAEFWQELESNPIHPQTSQPTIGDFKRLYQFLAAHHNAIISLHIPATLSGTFQAAQTAQKSIENCPIHVVDSLTATTSMGLIALSAAEMAEEGKSVPEILSSIEKLKKTVRSYIVLSHLENSVKGGRLSPQKKWIADLFRINPILSVNNGKMNVVGKMFGSRNKLEKLKKFILQNLSADKRYRFNIAHGLCEDFAFQLSKELKDKYGNENVYFSEIGPALAVHAGKESLSIGIQELDTHV